LEGIRFWSIIPFRSGTSIPRPNCGLLKLNPAHSEEAASSRPQSDELWNAVPRPHPEAGFQRVNDRLLAAGPDDFLHTFEESDGAPSEVAERIVELADGTRTTLEIAEALGSEFEVDPSRCRADTTVFIQLLVERQLLVLR